MPFALPGQTIVGRRGKRVVIAGGSITLPQFIISTDISGDADDAAALAIMCAAVQAGTAELLAVVTDSSNIYSAPVVKACLVAAGLSSVPVGAYQGSNAAAGSTSNFAAGIVNDFRPTLETRADYSDAVTVLRTALVAARSGVIRIGVGFEQSWADLLQSPADGISPLTGTQLVAAKLGATYIMGGGYPSGSEFNFTQNPAAAAYVFNNWPLPIVSIGSEMANGTSVGISASALQSNPFRRIFSLWGSDTRPAWDPITVDIAVNGLGTRYQISGANGINTVNASTGANSWSSTTPGIHSYTGQLAAQATISAAVQALVDGLAITNPGTIPAWVSSGAIIDVDCLNNRGWGGTLGTLMACVRSAAAYVETTTGTVTLVSANTLRVSDRGLLIENAGTNVVLWSNDLTNAAWTASNITAVKDQTGPDGVANSASKITAGAANSTILQAITLASSARMQSVWIKRVTGSGVVNMTTDGGTTWTAVTVTGTWAKVNIPTQTLANPSVGLRIVTSGDAVAVWCVQNETLTGPRPTSPIPTTTVAVTRPNDAVNTQNEFVTALKRSALTVFMQTAALNTPTFSVLFGVGTGAGSSTFFNVGSAVQLRSFANAVQLQFTVVDVNSQRTKMAMCFDATGRSLVANNGTVVTDATALPSRTTPFLAPNGYIERITLYPSRVSDVALKALTV